MRFRKAFSLVEVLVTIGIIMILLSLILPALSRAKARGRKVVCQNNLRQIGLGLHMYVDDNSNLYPYWVNPAAPEFDEIVGPENTRYWWAKLLPYHPVSWLSQSYHCPGYRGKISGEIGSRPPLGSYAYNARGVRPAVGGFKDPANNLDVQFPDLNFGLGPAYHENSPYKAVNANLIVNPSKMIGLGESRFLSSRRNIYPGGESDLHCGYLSFRNHDRADQYAFGEKRHGADHNVWFCDGHIEADSPWTWFDPRKSAAIWNYDNQPHLELWPPP